MRWNELISYTCNNIISYVIIAFPLFWINPGVIFSGSGEEVLFRSLVASLTWASLKKLWVSFERVIAEKISFPLQPIYFLKYPS